MIMLLLSCCIKAQIPAIQEIGKEAGKVKGVRHASVNNIMLGMAMPFVDKEKRAVFKMLDHIELIECKNSNYAQVLSKKLLDVVGDEGAMHLFSHDDGKALNNLYAVQEGDIVKELIILVYSHDKNFFVVAMSGKIPFDRLDEISKIKP